MPLLDKQLEAGIHGDFDKGWLIDWMIPLLVYTLLIIVAAKIIEKLIS